MSNQNANQALANLFGLIVHATADLLVEAMALQHPRCLEMYDEAVRRLRVVHLYSVEDSEESMFRVIDKKLDSNGFQGRTGYFQLMDGRIVLVMHDIVEDSVFVVWPQAKNPTQLSCVKYQGRYSRVQRHELCVSPQILEAVFTRFKPW